MKLYYNDLLITEVITNHSISIDEILDFCEIDMNEFARLNGFDDWDYDALRLEA